MSNYKWVKMSENYVQLRQEDFSSIPIFEVNDIDSLLLERLEANGVDNSLDCDGFLQSYSYILSAVDRKSVTITAPLYEYDAEAEQFILLSETYTAEAPDPAEYDWVKLTYERCAKEVASEQAKIFEEQFMAKSLDGGKSSIVIISSDFYRHPNHIQEEYVPESYIKVCEIKNQFSDTLHETVFIKKIDAKRQVVPIKIPDLYKGLVIGKGGENIKRVANLINARIIKVNGLSNTGM